MARLFRRPQLMPLPLPLLPAKPSAPTGRGSVARSRGFARSRRRVARFAVLVALGTGACGDDGGPPTTVDSGTRMTAPQPAPQTTTPAQREHSEREAVAALLDDGSPTVAIPAGTLRVGSAPGTRGRNASAEADGIALNMPGFSIDRRPYPNDPSRPPLTGVDRSSAAALCAEAGKRLCTELEWERACKGEEERRFASGAALDAQGTSPFGVHDLGLQIGEWTASGDVRELAPGTANAAVFRGASADQPEPLHRCAARRATAPTTRSRHLGFRCCGGEGASPPYPDERATPRVQRLEHTEAQIREALRSVPEVSSWAPEFRPASDESMSGAVGDLTLLHGWELAGSALSWTPVDGEEIRVYAGFVEERAVVIALFRTADGRLLHGASLLFDAEEGPVAVAFTPPERSFVQVSTDWARTAAGAVLRYTDDAQLVFEPR